MSSIAIVRIKGQVGMDKRIKDTFTMLKLDRKNYCTIIENKPELMGMVKKVKDFVAWGAITDEEKSKHPKHFRLSYIKRPITGNIKEKIVEMIKAK